MLAKLPVPRQADWIADCVAEENAGRRMTTRRLRKSLSLGRLASERDMEPDEADKGGGEPHPVREPAGPVVAAHAGRAVPDPRQPRTA